MVDDGISNTALLVFHDQYVADCYEVGKWSGLVSTKRCFTFVYIKITTYTFDCENYLCIVFSM